jgi:hypothetical protein
MKITVQYASVRRDPNLERAIITFTDPKNKRYRVTTAYLEQFDHYDTTVEVEVGEDWVPVKGWTRITRNLDGGQGMAQYEHHAAIGRVVAALWQFQKIAGE